MKNLYDIEPIYTTEEYVGYGKDDLSTMTCPLGGMNVYAVLREFLFLV